MTFTVSSKTLNEALNIISKVIASKNILPILDDFILSLVDDKLSITASDAENTMTTTVSITDGKGKGCFAINAKNLLEAMRNMADMQLTFDYDKKEKKVTVTYLNGVFSLPTDNADEFPQPNSVTPTLTINIPEIVLQEIIARTIFATSQDELRPIMNGIYFNCSEEALEIVATDGRQLIKKQDFIS